MSNKISQNIFDYATSELSQDAFISLLIAWFDSEEKELRDISKMFIASLYCEHFRTKEKLILNKMKSIKIFQQHYKIDVYFELKYDDKVISFIIEDKTWTEPHSNQLLKYVQKIVFSTKTSEEEIVKIFFKTGHITEKDEIETKIAKYTIIDTGWIYKFLNQYQIDNIIFNNYKEYLEERFYKKLYINNQKKELKDWIFKDVYNGYVQYAIIKEIKNTLILDSLFRHDAHISFTRNGKSWDTWWSFYNDGFSLFIKIKRIGKSYRIRLIKYSQSKIASADKQKNLEKFSRYIDEFLESTCNTNIKKTQKPRYKAREIEIAFLEINEEVTLNQVVEDCSSLIRFFIKKVKKL